MGNGVNLGEEAAVEVAEDNEVDDDDDEKYEFDEFDLIEVAAVGAMMYIADFLYDFRFIGVFYFAEEDFVSILLVKVALLGLVLSQTFVSLQFILFVLFKTL